MNELELPIFLLSMHIVLLSMPIVFAIDVLLSKNQILGCMVNTVSFPSHVLILLPERFYKQNSVGGLRMPLGPSYLHALDSIKRSEGTKCLI